MIGQSQSGTGKTAAFVLTMLSRIDFSKNKTQVRDMTLVARSAVLDAGPCLGTLSGSFTRTC
jgi:hypothetical protein